MDITVTQHTRWSSLKSSATNYKLDQTPESLILRPRVQDCSPMRRCFQGLAYKYYTYRSETWTADNILSPSLPRHRVAMLVFDLHTVKRRDTINIKKNHLFLNQV